MFGPPLKMNEDGIPKPKSLKQVPKYIGQIIKSFFSRYIYIFKLVWEANPWILLGMSFTVLFTGLFPVVGAYITAQVIENASKSYPTVIRKRWLW